MYDNIVEAIFIKRINRFIAEVIVNGNIEQVHVKNTGRCKELFIKGRTCYLEKSNNPKRKTKYSLISIYKDDMLINIDSQVPNKIVLKNIKEGTILKELYPSDIKGERQYKNSRFDVGFFSNKENKYHYLEVKGVTLENNGIVMFPDAPTSRGNKHILELIDAKKNNFGASVLFLVQLENPKVFKPNSLTDPELAKSLKLAKKNGVNILCYDSVVTKNDIILNNKIPVEI